MKTRLVWTVGILGIALTVCIIYYFWQRTEAPLAGLVSEEKSKATFAEQANEWRMLAWRDENGNIPSGGIAQALQEREAYLQQNLDENGFGERPISPLNWISRGPDNVGGRTRSVIVHPTDPNTIWAGSLGGGVWKSIDGGETWGPMNGELQNYVVNCMAIDPGNPDILYAGTGERRFNQAGPPGGGIFRSTNGGISWTRIADTNPSLPLHEGWNHVNHISISPENSGHILASTGSGIWRSVNTGVVWSNPISGGRSYYVSFHPTNGLLAIASATTSTGQTRVLWSTSGGATWFPATRTDIGNFQLSSRRIELAYHKNDPQIVYAFHADPSKNAQALVSYSEDGGHTFTPKSTNIPSGEVTIYPTEYATSFWVSPIEENLVVVGGNNPGHIFRSEDGGNNFVLISAGNIFQGDQPHVDQHCLVSVPNDPHQVYACNDGGVYKTNDIATANTTSGWENKSFTFRTSQYYGAAGQLPTGVLYGGTQDNGTTRSSMVNTMATSPFGGDGGFAAVAPDGARCYGEYIGLTIHRSNCVTGASMIYCGVGDEMCWPDPGTGLNRLEDANTGEANFIAPFVMDPNNPNRIIAGGASVWRTNDAQTVPQPSWFRIKDPNSSYVSAIAIAPGNSNIIWIAYNDNTLFKTVNGLDATPTWTAIDDNGTANEYFVRSVNRILIDNNSHDIVYVAQGGLTNGNLLKTTTSGVPQPSVTPWVDITGTGFPNAPVRGIARHPSDANKLYAGTEIGLYSTDDGGVNWDMERQGPTNVPVDEVTFMKNSTTLLAATHGRGLWTAETDLPVAQNYTPYDFDGDNRSDISVFRPDTGSWYLYRSRLGFTQVEFGNETDIVAVEDFDGDQKADLTVFRPDDAAWYRINSSDSTYRVTYFGLAGDIVVPADYDGDNLADEAVFRPSTGIWYINRSASTPTAVYWGLADDLPVASDFDGDGYADIGVFRLKDGFWYLYTTANGYQYIQFGMDGDMPVPADYDGDQMADVAVWRPSDKVWYSLHSATETIHTFQFGLSGDVPVPADYDGDGTPDIAVWRPDDGNWYFYHERNGYSQFHFGAGGDVPVSSLVVNRPGAFLRNSSATQTPAPARNASAGSWFAPGIPDKRRVRQIFKPLTVPGITDPDGIRQKLGQPLRRTKD